MTTFGLLFPDYHTDKLKVTPFRFNHFFEVFNLSLNMIDSPSHHLLVIIYDAL